MASELPEEGDVVRPNGPALERHLRFIRRLAALDVIAPKARAYQVLPGILSSSAFWNDVIDGQRHARRAAILTAMPIAPKDIFSRKDDFFKWNANVVRKPNYTRKRHRDRSRTNFAAHHAAYQFRLREIKQDDRFFRARDGQWFVIAIQDQDFSAELRIGWAKLAVVFRRRWRRGHFMPAAYRMITLRPRSRIMRAMRQRILMLVRFECGATRPFTILSVLEMFETC